MQNRPAIVDAFTRSARHSMDRSIVITRDPADLAALAHEDCKAVIWRRTLSPDLADVVERITPEQIGQLHDRCGQLRSKGRFDPIEARATLLDREIFEREDDALILADDIEMLGKQVRNIAADCKYPYAWFHGHLSITPKYHVDTIDVVRLSTVYKGRGMRFLAGRLLEDHYQAAATKDVYLDPARMERIYHMEELQPGDVVAAKSRSDGGTYGNTQALVHRSVAEEEGASRLFLGIDLYKPQF